MPIIRSDRYSKKRYISVIKFSFFIGSSLSFFVYFCTLIFSIYATVTNTLPLWLSLITIFYSIINLTSLFFLFIQEKDRPYNIRSRHKSNWQSEKKWLIITISSLNIIFVFIFYILIQRQMYNALV